MKKRLLIGILILTVFMVSLIPALAHAYTQDHYELTTCVGRGTVSNDAGFSAKVRATFLLGVTDFIDGTIEGVGKLQLAIQGFSRDIFALVQAMTITWSFNRGTKSLTVSGRIGGVDVFYLSGTVESNPLPFLPDETSIRGLVELSGTLTVGAKTLDLNLRARTIDTIATRT